MRDEASATDALARLVSYRPDKDWLSRKANALRDQANRQEQNPPRGVGPGSSDVE
jgi:hypothetical protein